MHYRRGDPNTAIGVLRALASNDDRAPVPALHLGLALLWSGQRGEATSELEQARLIEPDGFYGAPPTTSCTPRTARATRSGSARSR